MANDNGGIIGIINTPTADTASGVWSLDSQYQAQTTGTWPPIPAIGLNSARFNSGSSDNLSRTPSSATDRKTFTISFWTKLSSLATARQVFLNAGTATPYTNDAQTSFEYRDNQIKFGGGAANILVTTALYRDVSAWYHIVLAVDTTQGTDSNRVKLYVNGVQETSFATATYPSLNDNYAFNNNVIHYIGSNLDGASAFFDGYMSDFNLVDGQQLAPTSFGAFNANGVWTPIIPGVTYGTNGFRLKFENSANLGEDSSPNGNNFTVNNLTSEDQSGDYPVNNFATYNATLSQTAGVSGRSGSWNGQLAEGNLSAGTAVDIYNNQFSTFGVTSGKWYAEFKMSTTDNNFSHGIVNNVFFSNLGAFIGQSTSTGVKNIGYYCQNGQVLKNNSTQYTGSTYGVSGTDIISIALDLDNNYVYFAKNGTYQNSGDPTSGATGTGGVAIDADTTWFLGSTTHSLGSSGLKISYANFGHPPTGFTISSGNADGNGYGNFEYTVPSGYYSLCTKNLAEFG